VRTQSFFLIVSVYLSFLATGGCSLLGTRPDPTNDPSIDPVAEAAARVRAQRGESLIAIENPDAASELQRQEQERQENAIRRARSSGDITLGMAMGDVLSVWGEPRSIDTAGDPRQGNQRWVYFDGLSSRWSMSAKRIVYFEQGRVIGWEHAR
jgi:hypothetical protein